MVRGLYTAWTGMLNEQKRLDVISNNLANSATVGFKKEGVTSQAFKDLLTIKIKDSSENYIERPIGHMSLGVKIGEIYTDYNQGSLRETGNTYDLAIEGNGFFEMSVFDREGTEHTRYTRAGQFTITQDGYIVDVDGNHLISEGGYLQVPVDAANVVIAADGTVYADGAEIDKIVLTDFEDYNYLKKVGNTMYEPVEGAVASEVNSNMRQGYTEQSNVNVVSEMVNMIAITRAYEAGQKVIQSIDSTLEQTTTSVGKVG